MWTTSRGEVDGSSGGIRSFRWTFHRGSTGLAHPLQVSSRASSQALKCDLQTNVPQSPKQGNVLPRDRLAYLTHKAVPPPSLHIDPVRE